MLWRQVFVGEEERRRKRGRRREKVGKVRMPWTIEILSKSCYKYKMFKTLVSRQTALCFHHGTIRVLKSSLQCKNNRLDKIHLTALIQISSWQKMMISQWVYITVVESPSRREITRSWRNILSSRRDELLLWRKLNPEIHDLGNV